MDTRRPLRDDLPDKVAELLQLRLVLRAEWLFGMDEHPVLELSLAEDEAAAHMRIFSNDMLQGQRVRLFIMRRSLKDSSVTLGNTTHLFTIR